MVRQQRLDLPGQGSGRFWHGRRPAILRALGLTKPPRVHIKQTSVELSGAPGDTVETFLFVESPDKRPIYAHAVSESPWLHIGKSRSQGNTVRLALRVPTIPSMPGGVLEGRAIVTTNGNKRIPVTVTLRISGSSSSAPVAKIPLQPLAGPLAEPKLVPLPPSGDEARVGSAPVLAIDPQPSTKARVVQLEGLPSLPPIPTLEEAPRASDGSPRRARR